MTQSQKQQYASECFLYTRLQKTEKWGCISLGVCYAQVVFGAADEAATYSLTDQKV